jgi:hypothetical protein
MLIKSPEHSSKMNGIIIAQIVCMKAHLLTLLVFMTLGLCRADVPQLFTQRNFTSVTLVDAVNHFVGIGEDASVKELQEIISNEAADTNWIFSRGFSVDERIGWVCRILFEPKDGSPLRPPDYGRLNLPQKFMPLDKWPLYPLALSGSTYFVLGENYTADSTPESAEHYIAYCENNGVFRKMPVQLSTKAQAMQDALALRQCKSWQSIKWDDDHGFSYPLGERWTWGFMQNQIKSLPVELMVKRQPKTNSAVASLQ